MQVHYLGSVVQPAAGGAYNCALRGDGSVRCWGNNDHGQIGDGTTSQRREPVTMWAAGSGVAAIECGSSHACVLMNTGGVQCWGFNEDGQVGDRTTTDRLRPVDVVDLAGVASLGCANWHTCAIAGGGVLKCWVYYSEGQIGDGTMDNRTRPRSGSWC